MSVCPLDGTPCTGDRPVPIPGVPAAAFPIVHDRCYPTCLVGRAVADPHADRTPTTIALFKRGNPRRFAC